MTTLPFICKVVRLDLDFLEVAVQHKDNGCRVDLHYLPAQLQTFLDAFATGNYVEVRTNTRNTVISVQRPR